jgi:hypothetical protein
MKHLFQIYDVMPLQVYEGALGHIVIMEELPDLSGEQYLRVRLNPRDAEALCEKIMAVAKRARGAA